MKSIALELTDVEAQELAQLYETRVAELEVKIARYRSLLRKLETKEKSKDKNQLTISGENGTYLTGYSRDWQWTTKIKFVLKELNKISSSNEIVDKIISYEPNLGETDDARRMAIKSISATLSRKSKNGELGKYEDDRNRYILYGLSEWFDENNKPKNEHK